MEEQTAVEWLINELKNNEFLGFYCDIPEEENRIELMNKIIDEAKFMELEKLYESYLDGMRDESER